MGGDETYHERNPNLTIITAWSIRRNEAQQMDAKEIEIYVRVTHGSDLSWSRIHERTISLRFLGIILRVLSLIEVSLYNVYITHKIR